MDNSYRLENDGCEDFYSKQYVNYYKWGEGRYSTNTGNYDEKTQFPEPVSLNYGEEFPNSDTTDDPPNIIWSKTYGGYASSVQQTSDNGYILSGAISGEALIIKTDGNGSEKWRTLFGGDYDDYASDVVECSEGGYVCTGADGYTSFHGFKQVFLFKTDENGNRLWNKTFRRWGGNGEFSWGNRVIEVTDGYVILASRMENPGTWLIKTDLNGKELWNRTYGGKQGDADDGIGLIKTKDGGFIITGYTYSFDIGGGDIWLLKIDNEGNELWNKSYGGYSYDDGYDVIQTEDGGFVIVGQYTPIYEGWGDVCLIKTDSSGNMEWLRHYGGTDQDGGYSVTTTDDGGYAVVGMRHSGLTSFQGWLLKTDGNGNKLWDKVIGGRPKKIIRSNDGKYVVAGFNTGGAWLFKFEDFENNMPSKPTHVYNENSFQLKVASTDPDGDRIRYGISWYNNSVVDKWTDYYDSGEEGSINCFGKDKPAYVIAEDEHGGQSEWAIEKAKKPVISLLPSFYQTLNKILSQFLLFN